MDFRERYGPWAIVFGGSEGLGAAWAEECAHKGLNLVLVARRVAPLKLLTMNAFNVGLLVRLLSHRMAVRIMQRAAAKSLGLEPRLRPRRASESRGEPLKKRG